MSHLTEKQLSELYQQLLEEKHDLEKHFATNDNFGLSRSFIDSTGELSMYDNHPGDIATELYEREKDISLNEHAEFHLKQVDEALARMESGEYGICVFSKKNIPFERLQAIPTTQYCLEHVPEPHNHLSNDRPIEEQVLFPPFGRTSLDERNDETEFDGEDAWQIVESWGTSNTPAFAEDPNVENYNEMYIEADELVGYVETFESFVATDLYGEHVTIVRSKAYRDYMHNGEGDPLLEPENLSNSDDE